MFFPGFFCFSSLFTCFCLFPDNSVYLYKEEYRYLFQILPLFFIGVKFQNSEEIMKMLLVVAVASVVCVFFYNVVYHRIDIDENMVTAYNVLPNVLFLFAYYLYKREKWILFPIFLGLFLLFVLGTRGPVMACVLCAFVLCIKFFFDGFYKKSFVLFSMWVFFYVGIHLFSLQLENLFQRMGVSTRVLMSLIYAAKIDSSGRDLIYMKIYENIDFLKAHGFAGDRLLLGTYSHNMFLEIWYSFGFLGGSILLLCIFAIVLGALYYSKNIDSFFLIVLISFVFGQLMFSGSYLHQKWLFFLIGYSINIITKERNSISNTKKYFKRMC